VVAIGSIEDLAAEGGTPDEAGVGEAGEFALHGANAGGDFAGDLAGEEGLVGGSEEEGQDLAPGLAEEQVSDGGGCCTQNEYWMEESGRRAWGVPTRSESAAPPSELRGRPAAARKRLRRGFFGTTKVVPLHVSWRSWRPALYAG